MADAEQFTEVLNKTRRQYCKDRINLLKNCVTEPGNQ